MGRTDVLDRIVQAQKQLSNLEHQHWQDNVVFSFNWWLLVFVLIVPWLLWWKLVDKKRITEILLYGFYVMVVSSTLDDIGLASALWTYPYQLIQIMDRLNSVDLTALPIIYMLIYQYFSNWKSFFLANVFLALVLSFVCEPIVALIGIYTPLTWKYMYSFPIYILIAVIGKWFIEKIEQKVY